MMSLPLSASVFLVVEPQNMRKSFNGLSLLTERFHPGLLAQGALFAFINKRRNLLKIIYYDRTGICIMSKRLEKGTFAWPPAAEGKKLFSVAPEALQLLIDGADFRGTYM